VAHKPEAGGWTDVGRPGFEFLFSLYQNSLIEVTKRDGEVILGYFRSLNRNGAQIDISPPHSAQLVRAGIGSKLLLTFRKLTVDRLGRISEIVRETRTWHGAACT
jgi:CRISPR-associated endonuclease Csn1